MNYQQEYLGIKLVNIPSGLGGVLPAAVCKAGSDDKETYVICLHPDYYTNWVLKINTQDISSNTHVITDEMKAIIRSRIV